MWGMLEPPGFSIKWLVFVLDLVCTCPSPEPAEHSPLIFNQPLGQPFAALIFAPQMGMTGHWGAPLKPRACFISFLVYLILITTSLHFHRTKWTKTKLRPKDCENKHHPLLLFQVPYRNFGQTRGQTMGHYPPSQKLGEIETDLDRSHRKSCEESSGPSWEIEMDPKVDGIWFNIITASHCGVVSTTMPNKDGLNGSNHRFACLNMEESLGWRTKAFR